MRELYAIVPPIEHECFLQCMNYNPKRPLCFLPHCLQLNTAYEPWHPFKLTICLFPCILSAPTNSTITTLILTQILISSKEATTSRLTFAQTHSSPKATWLLDRNDTETGTNQLCPCFFLFLLPYNPTSCFLLSGPALFDSTNSSSSFFWTVISNIFAFFF